MKKSFTLLLMVISINLWAQQDAPKMILVEHFTNTLCSTCAARNPDFNSTLSNYSDQVIRLTYHPTSPFPSCIFAQHNTSGNNNRTNFYNIFGGTPRVVVNGNVINASNPLLNDGRVNTESNETSPFSISITQEIRNDSALFEVNIEKVNTFSDIADYNLYVALIEETINYEAPNGENTHRNVFRIFLDETNNIILPLEIGDVFSFSYETIIDQEWNENEISAVAFLQNTNTNEILQSGKSEKSGNAVSISEEKSIAQLIYPNPAKNFVHFNNENLQFNRIEIYNIIGSLIYQSSIENTQKSSIDISNFQSGNYIVRFIPKDANRKLNTQKLTVY